MLVWYPIGVANDVDAATITAALDEIKQATGGTLDAVFDGPFPGVDLEHAALLETSMMLSLHPDLVDLDALPVDQLGEFPPYDVYPQTGDGVPSSGVLAPVSGASAEKGQRLINDTVAAMVLGLGKAFSS